jgi:hypothetical protein
MTTAMNAVADICDVDPLDSVLPTPGDSASPLVHPLQHSDEQGIGKPEPVGKHRSKSWCELAYNCLGRALKSNLLERFGEQLYGSDCSGIDAPVHALRSITALLKRERQSLDSKAKEASSPPCLVYTHASEINDKHGDAAKLALTMNGSPEVLVCDSSRMKLQERKKTVKGWDSYTCKYQELRKPTIYTCGFECQDRSTCNISAPKILDIAGALKRHGSNGEDGRSSKTLASSVRFIGISQPDLFLIEHTFRKDTVKQVLQVCKKKLKQYKVRTWVTCSRQFGLPMTRRRLFAVGVNTEKLQFVLPMSRWTSILRKMATTQQEQRLHLQQCLVSPDDEASPPCCRAHEC